MLSCRDINQHADDHIEGRLKGRLRLAVGLHLFMCRHCRRYIRQLRLSRHFWYRSRPDRLPPEDARRIADATRRKTNIIPPPEPDR